LRRLDLTSVNWWDGMLVSRAHFEAQERYHEEALRWLARYGLPLHGLLPASTGDAPPLQIRASFESENRLRVEVLHCRAVTRDGTLIHIDADSEAQERYPVVGTLEINSQQAQTIPVYLRARAEKQPLGAPDPTGNAPRRTPSYEVLLVEAQAPGDGSCLKVAEIAVANYKAEESAEYLPPAFSAAATQTLRRATDEIRRVAQIALDEVAETLRTTPPAADMHPWNLAARGMLDMVLGGWSVAIELMVGWETAPPPLFVGSLRSLLRVFANGLTAASPVKADLDEHFLQTGGLPGPAGGIDFHNKVARYVASPYVHEAMGRQMREGAQLLEYTRDCLRFIGEKLTSAGGEVAEAPKPKVTYRQQDYYLLEVNKIESSFSEESQVLYFRDLETRAVRSILFVLRNNVAPGVDERDIRLKGGVNDDRPLYCPELQPDFKERPGRIYLLMEVERNKRENANYLTLRSSGVVDLKELLQKKDTDIRVYYL
jgi:hypothetical protein